MNNLDQLWKFILEEVSKCKEVTALAYDLWIKTLSPVCICNNNLVLLAESQAQRNILQNRHVSHLHAAAKKVYPAVAGIELIVENEREAYSEFVENSAKADVKTPETLSSDFITKYTFDNFVVGKSNEFLAAAAKAVAESPGQKYNPLFIYGGVGLGKTHVMHAIGNYLKQTNPKIKALYISCERFTNELIESLRDSNKSDAMKEFRHRYRNVDVLMIDDIQFIAKTVSTQEELFHTFNDLHSSGKQVIISSDRPPKEITPLEERLRTRFEWGLIADVGQPDFETRMAILQKKALQENYNISNDVLREIAQRVQSNIREMEGLLTKIVSFASLTNRSVNDIEVVHEALKDYGDDKNEAITIDAIANAVIGYFRVDKASLVGKKKNKEIVEPRHMCIYLITELSTMPLESIGHYFGGRDHTTIMHARDKVTAQLKTNSKLSMQVKDLKDLIFKK